MTVQPAPLPSPAPACPHTRAESLLAAHVPLSLLLDLVDPSGPHSLDLMTAEPGTADWLR